MDCLKVVDSQPSGVPTSLLILTPGPVMMEDAVLALGGMQTPYFRNQKFSSVVKDCENLLLSAVNAPKGSRAVFLTGSGTAAMEAAVMNFTDRERRVLIVQGGSFGQRFVDIAYLHRRAVHVIPGDRIRKPLSGSRITATSHPATALLINAHETSTGHLYDLQDSADYCIDADALHIVDAISSFGADPINMLANSIDVLVLSSNKALGLQPGLSMLIMTPRAMQRLPQEPVSFYFNIPAMLKDGLRGQTPFTPAVNTILQLQLRLTQWAECGMAHVVEQTAQTAEYFRRSISDLPLRNFAAHPSNALTALEVPIHLSAKQVVDRLEAEHGIVVAANGGALAERVFRVTHMGKVGNEDMGRVSKALCEILLETVT